jgi:hypothetical protein
MARRAIRHAEPWIRMSNSGAVARPRTANVGFVAQKQKQPGLSTRPSKTLNR